MLLKLLLFLLIPQICFAAAPTRATSYTPQTTIRSADVTNNENVIFNYLQAGVDTYADNTIVNADVNASAAISYSKLSLANSIVTGDIVDGTIVNADISGSAAIAYSKLSLGTSIVNADISASAAIVGSKLDLTSPGAIGSTSASTGAFSTLKVGTTNQGDILYDNGTSLVRLTPGTSGQVLVTKGASANPVWGSSFVPGNIQVFTSSGTWTKPSTISTVYVKVWGGGAGGANGTGNTGGIGGGAGGYSEGITAVTGNVTVTVGASVAAGTDGNLSSFAGTTTLTANGGATAGTGGTASSGSINLTGDAGSSGASGAGAQGGRGGGSPFGGAGGSGGPTTNADNNNGVGSPGQTPGGGGGGGNDSSGAGGTGAAGMVIVYY